ncbi:MAG: hypothetical protein GY777_12415 [Candidatus Brocadiaceae bacterium]|nr:hypothetical protein [Candidatus Brocadiaceae bacterium]
MFDNTSFVAEGLRMYMHLPDIDRKYVTQEALQYCKSKEIVVDESSIEEKQYNTHFAGCYKGNLIAITISNYTASNYTVIVDHMLTSFPGTLYMEGCQ